MIDLRQILQDKRDLLDRQLAEAKFTRDHAATPTESHSDKTRQNAEQLMDTLNDAKKKLRILEIELNKLPSFSNTATTNTLVTLPAPLSESKTFSSFQMVSVVRLSVTPFFFQFLQPSPNHS